MMINHLLPDESEVEILKKDLDGLNEVYKDIADEIGVENTLIIYKLFRGTQISFPSRLFSKEYIHKAIISEYNGKNIPQFLDKQSPTGGLARDIRDDQLFPEVGNAHKDIKAYLTTHNACDGALMAFETMWRSYLAFLRRLH